MPPKFFQSYFYLKLQSCNSAIALKSHYDRIWKERRRKSILWLGETPLMDPRKNKRFLSGVLICLSTTIKKGTQEVCPETFCFFLYNVLCLYATLWLWQTWTDLYAKKNFARINAPYLYIYALSRRVYSTTFGDFPLLILAYTELNQPVSNTSPAWSTLCYHSSSRSFASFLAPTSVDFARRPQWHWVYHLFKSGSSLMLDLRAQINFFRTSNNYHVLFFIWLLQSGISFLLNSWFSEYWPLLILT